jgi:O-antigen/teichoic acid export membrane protein
MDRSFISKFFKKPILRSLAVAGSGIGTAQLFMLISAFLLARFLSPAGFGLYTASYAICTLTAFLFNWGLDTWLLRQASIDNKPKFLVGTVISIKFSCGIIWAALIVIFLPMVQPATYLRPILFLCCIDVLCDGLFTVQIALLNAQKLFSPASIFMNLSRGGRLLFAIILILLGARDPDLFIIARLIATGIGLICLTIYTKPVIHPRLDRYTLQVFQDSIPFGFSDLLSAIYLQADVSILAIISGNRMAVGTYSPASGLINALFILPNAAFYVFLPTITQLINQGSLRFTSFILKMFGGYTGLGMLLTLGICFLGEPAIVFILGNAYQETGLLLVRLSPLLFMKSIEFGCTSLLVACGLQKSRLVPQILSATLNIILNVIYIPQYGVWAVANNYLISEVVLFLGYLWIALSWVHSYHPSRNQPIL